MNSIYNDSMTVSISDDGLQVIIADKKRGEEWRLNNKTFGYEEKFPADWAYPEYILMENGKSVKISENEIDVDYDIPGGKAIYKWTIQDDCVEVKLNVISEKIVGISHPTGFESKGDMEVLVPFNQGLLFRNTGEDFSIRINYNMMKMFGVLSKKAGLLVVCEDVQQNTFMNVAKKGNLLISSFEATKCDIEGWYERKVRIYVADNSITAVCKKFRQRIIQRGDFVSWEEKIRKKPILEKLFGSLIAFIGYNKGRSTDYVKCAKIIKDMGFDSVLYYPVRFNAMVLDFLMGGDEPIWLSDGEINAMKELGGILSPWSWNYEALDVGNKEIERIWCRTQDGKPKSGWQIDNFKWYKVCTPYQTEFIKKQYKGDMREMGWIHYDVNAIRGGEYCYSDKHEVHGNRPLSPMKDNEFVAELLSPETNGNRIVSSEGFREYFTKYYDIGSNKYTPVCGFSEPKIPVPMTMLVFHDSTVQNWWEIDTYNKNGFGGLVHDGMGWRGDGASEKKSAMDALYGCPPLVFPFGRQYGWIDAKAHKTFSYEVDINDPETQKAFKYALPVAKLHKKIGKLEMKSFEFVTDDYSVQTTLFSDGTRIVANISDNDVNTKEFGLIPANSWRTE